MVYEAVLNRFRVYAFSNDIICIERKLDEILACFISEKKDLLIVDTIV